MQTLFVPRGAWVLSGSMIGWGDSVVDQCDAVIFLSLNSEERMRRIEAREATRRAGDAFDEVAWEQFLEWARGYDNPMFSGRSRAGHENWLQGLNKPVLRLDSAQTQRQLVDAVLNWQPSA